jgi:preprotein translocase subunit SecE
VNYRILIWVVVVGAAFVYFWRTGQLARLKNYWDEMMVEMWKCSWPTWAELKGSTVVVGISILLLGGFTVAVDAIFVFFVNWIT